MHLILSSAATLLANSVASIVGVAWFVVKKLYRPLDSSSQNDAWPVEQHLQCQTPATPAAPMPAFRAKACRRLPLGNFDRVAIMEWLHWRPSARIGTDLADLGPDLALAAPVLSVGNSVEDGLFVCSWLVICARVADGTAGLLQFDPLQRCLISRIASHAR